MLPIVAGHPCARRPRRHHPLPKNRHHTASPPAPAVDAVHRRHRRSPQAGVAPGPLTQQVSGAVAALPEELPAALHHRRHSAEANPRYRRRLADKPARAAADDDRRGGPCQTTRSSAALYDRG